jgi:4-hydroxy-3-methylbut-2-en-1-yl diphosphate synthase IspG/GcpE
MITRTSNRFIACPTCERRDFDHADWCDFAATSIQQSESVIHSANQPDTVNR